VARLERQDIVPFEKRPWSAARKQGISDWQGYKTAEQSPSFRDNYFVATDGGS